MPPPLLLRRVSALRRKSSPHCRLPSALSSLSPVSQSTSQLTSPQHPSAQPSSGHPPSQPPSPASYHSTPLLFPWPHASLHVSASHWPSSVPALNRPLDTSVAAPLVDSPIPASSQSSAGLSVTCRNAIDRSLRSQSAIRSSQPFIGFAVNQSLFSQPRLNQSQSRLSTANQNAYSCFPNARGFASDTLLPLQIEASDNRTSHSESAYSGAEVPGEGGVSSLSSWDHQTEPQEGNSGALVDSAAFETSRTWVEWGEPQEGESGALQDAAAAAGEAAGAGGGGDGGAAAAAAGAGAGAGWLGSWAWLGVPVDAVTQALTSIQASTGAPWWLTLVGSTLALRLSLFPLTWHQMKISSQLAALGPKLPPPFPLPGSGMTWSQAWALRQRRRRQLHAPSALWLLAAPAVQIPIFFTWIFTMRHMALSAHPGFDAGGCLWLEDLTAFPQGVLGWVLPLSIAGTFLTSLQVMMPLHKMGVNTASEKAMLAYRTLLEFLTLPIAFAALNVPQAVHVYWLTNNTFTLAQAFALRSPTIRQALGLPTIAQLQDMQQQHARTVAAAAAASGGSATRGVAAADPGSDGDDAIQAGAGGVGRLMSEQEIATLTDPHALLVVSGWLTVTAVTIEATQKAHLLTFESTQKSPQKAHLLTSQ
ncbi:hypothetical protein CLOP_g7072 [Closterium sp. NIES-67]|nr:hypothetical protein CLOP_g7072 [Closterium sp. NIES-67]